MLCVRNLFFRYASNFFSRRKRYNQRFLREIYFLGKISSSLLNRRKTIHSILSVGIVFLGILQTSWTEERDAIKDLY